VNFQKLEPKTSTVRIGAARQCNCTVSDHDSDVLEHRAQPPPARREGAPRTWVVQLYNTFSVHVPVPSSTLTAAAAAAAAAASSSSSSSSSTKQHQHQHQHQQEARTAA
jgi:hypothetical protein